MWFAEKGAMTGEISPVMLEGLAKFVILGHSERRMHFGESNALINDKVQAALNHKITPIIAVGELKKMSIQKRGAGRPSEVNVKLDVIEQLKAALKGIPKESAKKIIVAYEPVWAIGTGTPATGEYANEVAFKLRRVLIDKFGDEIAQEIRILYGGSVDSGNIKEFVYQPEIDGALVGGVSL
jgi:triosephosphate isomerase